MDASKKYASVVINQMGENAFQETLSRYRHFDQFQIFSKAESARFKEVGQMINEHDVIVISIVSKTNKRSKNYGITQNILDLITVSYTHLTLPTIYSV